MKQDKIITDDDLMNIANAKLDSSQIKNIWPEMAEEIDDDKKYLITHTIVRGKENGVYRLIASRFLTYYGTWGIEYAKEKIESDFKPRIEKMHQLVTEFNDLCPVDENQTDEPAATLVIS